MTDITDQSDQSDPMRSAAFPPPAGPEQPENGRHTSIGGEDRYETTEMWAKADADGYPPPLHPAQPDLDRPTPLPPVGERSEPTEIIGIVTAAAVNGTPPVRADYAPPPGFGARPALRGALHRPVPPPPPGGGDQHTEIIGFFADPTPSAGTGHARPPAHDDRYSGYGRYGDDHYDDGDDARAGGSEGGGSDLFSDEVFATGTNAAYTRKRTPAAGRGWRRAVAKMSGGVINPAPSAREEQHKALLEKIRSPLVGVNKVAFANAKGGVGKTTMTVAVGSAIAHIRGDRVIAVDVNTDLGDMSARFREEGGVRSNIEELASLAHAEQRSGRRRGADSSRYSTVREFTVQNEANLEGLASQNDPRSTYLLTRQDYLATMQVLERHYNQVLLDCGTSITSPLFSTIAEDVSTLVVVASQNDRGINLAKDTLAWLSAHGLGRLLGHTVVVLNATDRGKPLVNLDAVETAFRQIVGEVVRVPYDPHLAEGGAIDYGRLRPPTRTALLDVAGAIADHYPVRHSRSRSGDIGGY